jgi:putative peptidoglycan lipid II flippase
VGGWLLAVVADVVLSGMLPADDRALALGAGHTLGVTVAGGALLVVVWRVAGRSALHGVPHAGAAALLAAGIAAAAGWWVTRALDADPVPTDGVLAAIGVGALAAASVLVVALAVMMGTARGPLGAALRELRSSGRQEVHGG